MGKKHFYAVRRGRQVGVYTSWDEARTHVDGFAGAHFQGFATHSEAIAWMQQGAVGGVRQRATPAAAAMQHELRPAHPQQPSPYSYHAAAAAAGLQFADSAVDPARTAYAAAAAARAHAHPYVKREPAVKPERSSPWPEPQLPHLSQRGMHTSVRASSVITDSCCTSSQDSLPGLERPDGTRVKREPAAAAAASPASAASSSSAAAVAASSSSAASPSLASAAASPVPLPIRYGILYADGAAKSNPTGPCGCGGILYEATLPLVAPAAGGEWAQGAGITCYKRFLGVRSNNEAEYSALIVGLEAALAHRITHLTVRMDSELVVKQMSGEYKVKAANLLPLYNDALKLAAQFEQINVQHIYRDANKEADELANEAITDAIGFNGAGAGAGQRQQQPNRYRRDY